MRPVISVVSPTGSVNGWIPAVIPDENTAGI